MNRSQALKEAVRLYGKTAAVQDKGKKYASTPEERAAASAELKTFRDSIPKDRRLTREERQEKDRLFWLAMRQRYTVGLVSTLGPFRAFMVRGSGDTWEGAFAEAAARDKIAA